MPDQRLLSSFKRTRDTNIPLMPNDTLQDWGVEADMLANADVYGKAIIDAPPAVRKRAALERGLTPFLHVRPPPLFLYTQKYPRTHSRIHIPQGGSVSAVCADVKWGDPRTEEELQQAKPDDPIEWKNPLRIAQWKDDERLAGFEDRFFGGCPFVFALFDFALIFWDQRSSSHWPWYHVILCSSNNLLLMYMFFGFTMDSNGRLDQ